MHCFITYPKEMRKIMQQLGIKIKKDVAAITIKPADVRSIEDEMYHPSLQIFFTERVGGERNEVYSKRKNPFIFTILVIFHVRK